MDFLSIALHAGLIITLAIISILYYNHSRHARMRLSRASLSEKLSIATGYKALMGMRPTMEDGHVMYLNLRYDEDKTGDSQITQQVVDSVERPSVCLFGVFDGHSGTACSDFLSANMHKFISKERDIFYGITSEQVCEGLCRAFLAADTAFATAFFTTNKRYGDRTSVTVPTPGSTACVGVLNKDKIYIANAGDSRAVLGRVNNVDFSVFHVDLSKDHKPSRPTETMRIRSIGGSVQTSHISSNKCLISVGPLRVWPGGLSVSRGIGDFSLKANKELEVQGIKGDLVSPYPEIRYTPTSIYDQFLVIACDGLYDVLTSEEVVNFIYTNRPLIMIEEMLSAMEYRGNTIALSHPEEELSDSLPDQHTSRHSGTKKFSGVFRALHVGIKRLRLIIHRSFALIYGRLLSSPMNPSEVSTALLGDKECVERVEFNNDLVQMIDCKCAQRLADKLANLALEREATDNISVIVVLFRWNDVTPKTIEGWRAYNQIISMHSVREDGDLRPPIPEISDEDSCIARNRADDVILWVSKDDPGYAYIKK